MQRVCGHVAATHAPAMPVVAAPTPVITGPRFFPAVPIITEVDDACPLSCMKGNAPKIGAQIQFDEKVSYGFSIMRDDSKMVQGTYRKSAAQFIDEYYKQFGDRVPLEKLGSLTSEADAIRRAVHLARGGDRLDDPEDTDHWEGSVLHDNEVRGDVILWMSDRVLIYGDSLDEYATYGRWCVNQGPTECMSKEEAMAHYATNWD